MYFPPALHKKLVEKIEADLFATICGPVRKPPQTALRVTGSGGFETVELDDAGKVIEPLRCTCGHNAIIHRTGCPFWALVT